MLRVKAYQAVYLATVGTEANGVALTLIQCAMLETHVLFGRIPVGLRQPQPSCSNLLVVLTLGFWI